MLIIYFIFILIISNLFLISKNPLTLGSIVIVQSILISLIIYLISSISWYSFLILIVFVSAIIVIFAYVASLANNKYYLNKIKIIPIFSTLMLIIVLTPNLINYIYIIPVNTNINYDKLFFVKTIHKIYLTNINLTVILVSYLLLALIVVVYVINLTEGSLKQKLIV